MPTLDQIKQQRQAAGQAYAAAAVAYLDAYTELRAHDIALGVHEVGPGFAELRPPSPHAQFLRDPLHGGVHERAMARSIEINASKGT